MPDRVALVEALGLTVVPVSGLRDNVVFVRSQGVVLVRPDLDDQSWDDALDYLLVTACQSPPPGR